MLVLSRKKNESIFIRTEEGVLIKIVAVECAPKKMRIGIDAPSSVQIMREELIDPNDKNFQK